jgi:hypothetical protein
VIYCVIPKELEAELYERLVSYTGPDRRGHRTPTDVQKKQRKTRGRRRPRAMGTFASTDIVDP